MKQQTLSGTQAEQLARDELEMQGLRLITANFSSRFGEIDLIMRDGSVIVFVEVRYRKNSNFGSALESVDRRKQKKLILSAQWFLQSRRESNTAARFDVMGISPNPRTGILEYNWCRNAFTL